MNKIWTVVAAMLVVALFGVAIVYTQKQHSEVLIDQQPISREVDSAIRAQVTALGSELKNVSLLAAPDELAKQMQLHYSAYVAPQLLAHWQADPTAALGRSVSSPWPDRIDIVSVTKQGDVDYTVEGNVIEITSSDPMPAAVYPVTLHLQLQDNTWVVASAAKGAYSELPKRISVQGVWECLPHKDSSGPQTMECAFGIAADQSDAHYALDLHLMQSTPVDFPTGAHIKVEGIMTPANQLSSDAWQKYPIDGIISATSIQKI